MADSDETTEAAPARSGRSLFRRKAQDPAEQATAGEARPAPARAAKTGRQMPESTKRLLFALAGVLVLVASVAGFYLTSDVFDERVPVLVATRSISAGETVGAGDFGSELVLVGSVPHVAWSPDVPFTLEGMVALQPIAAGSLVRYDLFVEAETVPVGVELEVVVPLDVSLVTGEVSEGEVVLLVDPGVGPAVGDDGRPRRVVREFKLTNFDGAQMTLFLAPEEWAEWEAMLADVGGTLLVVDLGVGAEPQETTQRLDEVWEAQWSAAVAEAAAAAAAAAAEPEAGPGEFEVIVSLDASLSPSGVSEGDLVLLIDPGAEPLGNDRGRPPMVIDTFELQNFDGEQMRLFISPEEWLYWRSLPEELGAAPMILPVAQGTDIDDITERLNAQWRTAWETSVADAGAAQ